MATKVLFCKGSVRLCYCITSGCDNTIYISSSLPGLRASLERLQLEYIDVVFANRPDPNTPIEGEFV